MIKTKKMIAMSIGVSALVGMFTSTAYAAEKTPSKEKTTDQSVKINQKSVEDFILERKAKEIIESSPESSPLTMESKEEIVEYYADTYLPTKGCALFEDLPKDSNINYVKPKPKPKKVKRVKQISYDKVEQQKVRKASRNKISQQQPQQTSTTSPQQATSVPQQPQHQHQQSTVEPQTKEPEQKQVEEVSNGRTISMSSEDRKWLEKLVEAEATGESYEGKVAVATVIANRVESSSFPNSVIGVIKAGNGRFHQFSPWDDGRIYKINPTNSTKRAVASVFDNGVRNLPSNTTYFAVESIAFDNWIGKTREYVKTIGGHAFFLTNHK